MKLSHRTILEIVILTWTVIVLVYLVRTPVADRTHDLVGHLGYTKIVAQEKRLPSQLESTQSNNPPLYYLVNSLVAPKSLKSGGTDKTVHIQYTKLLSVIYGVVTLLLIGNFLKRIAVPPLVILLILLFVGTTPEFVFVFTSYNNDSLAVLLSVALLVSLWSTYNNWSLWKMLVTLIIAICGLYVKCSMIFCLLSVILICLIKIARGVTVDKKLVKILAILLTSIVLFLPWLIFHEGSIFLMGRSSGRINMSSVLLKGIERLSTVLKIPVLQTNNKEWKKPWVYPVTKDNIDSIHVSSKSFDYLSYIFVTSVIGEYEFKSPGIRVIWFLLGVHLFVYAVAVSGSFSSSVTKLAFGLIVLSHITHMLSLAFYETPILGYTMDYAHIFWSLLCWTILYSSAAQSKREIVSSVFSCLLLVGTIIHLYVLMTVL